MLYELLYPLAQDATIFNLLRYITFRTAGATVTAIFICLIFGGFFVNLLKKYQIRESIREELPESHKSKAGTPTMGGLIIIMGIVIPTLLWADLSNFYVNVALIVTVWLGALGFLDDYLKVVKKRPRGLVGRFKLVGQVTLGLLVALILIYDAPSGSAFGSTEMPFLKNVTIPWGVFYIPLVILVITGTSNAVNLTDGLDGLAIGLCGICFFAFAGLAYITGRLDYSDYLQVEYMAGSGELTVFCGAAIGATLGFLWFNSNPAEVFMGDTGALALGGILGVLALLLKKELLLVILGGVFVAEALSVILQVGSFKLTGKRIFKMAPLHHHFELLGWPEQKVVVRFWIIGALFALLALATLKVR
ncbi:MAG: phospho-N-acetylmuramoyl-pentapeptide-transferase [candidate division Zixibacteria bacterium]|nr:phospho-N-acetylmuramoyl-pentapeptide-transferase [candidate division Zixibacteria bacterium]